MKKSADTLRKRLFLWYVGSLLLMTIFVVLVVHILALKNGFYFLAFLFLTLAFFGFLIIYRITKSLNYLTSRMKMISSKNLDERVEGVEDGDEIGGLAFTFNQLLDRLHQSFKREQQFIADVAHELKTPLATLRSTLEVTLNHNRTNNEYRKAIGEAIRETHRVSSTLKNVLDLAWSETPMEQKNAKVFDFTKMCEELLDLGQKMGMAKHIRVTGKMEKDIMTFGFREKLERAVLNIMDNAIKYSHRDGEIKIDLSEKNDVITLQIKDNGMGISKSDIPHIFDRFYRGSSSDKTLGSGLGLAIAKGIVVAHRGSIAVESEVGKGTVFVIELPSV